MPRKPAKEKPQAEAKAAKTEPPKGGTQNAGPTADELDAVGAKTVAIEEVHENKPEPERVEDTSPSDQPDLVPDGPFHGKWWLLVGVDFADEDGKDVHIDAGVIEGSDLPVDFATSLYETYRLMIKA